jgi:hypothetical protein
MGETLIVMDGASCQPSAISYQLTRSGTTREQHRPTNDAAKKRKAQAVASLRLRKHHDPLLKAES